MRASLAGILSDEGYEVQAVESGEAGLAALEGRRYDLVLLDVWLPGIDGLETLSRLRTLDPDVPVIVISGHGNIETAVKAVRMGAQDFVEKPLSLEKTINVEPAVARSRDCSDLDARVSRRHLASYLGVTPEHLSRLRRSSSARSSPSRR